MTLAEALKVVYLKSRSTKGDYQILVRALLDEVSLDSLDRNKAIVSPYKDGYLGFNATWLEKLNKNTGELLSPESFQNFIKASPDEQSLFVDSYNSALYWQEVCRLKALASKFENEGFKTKVKWDKNYKKETPLSPYVVFSW